MDGPVGPFPRQEFLEESDGPPAPDPDTVGNAGESVEQAGKAGGILQVQADLVVHLLLVFPERTAFRDDPGGHPAAHDGKMDPLAREGVHEAGRISNEQGPAGHQGLGSITIREKMPLKPGMDLVLRCRDPVQKVVEPGPDVRQPRQRGRHPAGKVVPLGEDPPVPGGHDSEIDAGRPAPPFQVLRRNIRLGGQPDAHGPSGQETDGPGNPAHGSVGAEEQFGPPCLATVRHDLHGVVPFRNGRHLPPLPDLASRLLRALQEVIVKEVPHHHDNAGRLQLHVERAASGIGKPDTADGCLQDILRKRADNGNDVG